jgi:hypothetical protein
MYAKVVWEKVAKYVKTRGFLAKALPQGFYQTWDARGVLCRRIIWERQCT